MQDGQMQQGGSEAAVDEFNVERSIRYRLAMLSRLWTVSTERIYLDQFGMTLSEWRILAIVGSEQPIYANVIAERGLIEKSRVSRIVAKLVERGVLETRDDEQDSRRNLLLLTAAGQRLYREIALLSLKRDALFEKALTARERAEFDRMVGKLLNWSFTVTGN
ncbi:MarR family winged helix-turn-helix transcriptional regulator [Polymorphobacter sp.]|uniref:MarR family winged helix-turn-helix transcriptional regulator n=1 Tax=Polymorphobacter sp. TaxID=1909290 RepID=UPI003F6E9641